MVLPKTLLSKKSNHTPHSIEMVQIVHKAVFPRCNSTSLVCESYQHRLSTPAEQSQDCVQILTCGNWDFVLDSMSTAISKFSPFKLTFPSASLARGNKIELK